jgi:hypothetical protein
MSQSDYLKYKRVSTALKIDGNDKIPVLESQNYVNYKQYALENTIENTSVLYNRITPANKRVIFGMDKNTTSCPSFIVCRNTQSRPNRVPMSAVYFTPTPMPRTITDTKHAGNQKTDCKCALNSQYTDRNLCKCRLGGFGIVR